MVILPANPTGSVILARLRRILQSISLLSGIILIVVGWPTGAWATHWVPVAEIDQEQQQQFIDSDSIDRLGQGRVRVNSYYLDRRQGKADQTAYLTEYNCPQRQFRDVEYAGAPGSSIWYPVDADPLNAATLEYVCAQAGYSTGPLAPAKN